MKINRIISPIMAALLAFVLLPLGSVSGNPAGGLFVAVDLIAEGDWSVQTFMLCTPRGGGLDVVTTGRDASITVPLDVTVNMTKNELLVLKLSGFPAGSEWNWVLDYRDSNGMPGTVGAKSDWRPEGWFGNYDGTFPLRDHFNWRKDNESAAAANMDISNITFTALYFYARVPANTSFRIETLALASRTDHFRGSSSWARAGIDAADRAGMVPQDLLNHFQSAITRENFCRLVVAFVEVQTGMTIGDYLQLRGLTPAPAFADSSRAEVLAAAALGIVQGVGGNRFNPSGQISRAEAAVMLANVCKALGVNIENAPATAYTDQGRIASWARPQISFVTENGIMTGSNNAFMPEGPYETQQAILTFSRIGSNVEFIADDPDGTADVRDIAAALWKPEYTHGSFTGPEAVTAFDAYRNRALRHTMPGPVGRDDVKYVFHAEHSARVVNVADGYALTLPKPFTPDFSRSALSSRYTGSSYILRVSVEDKGLYANTESGWEITREEFDRYFANDSYLRENGLIRTRPAQVNTGILPGYTVYRYSIKIGNRPGVEYPYYNIAAIRQNNEYNRYVMLHYKSRQNDNERFDRILSSFTAFTPSGRAQNDKTPFEPVVNPNWNAETKAYYDLLRGQETVSWGMFGTLNDFNWLQNTLEVAFDVIATYGHINLPGSRVRFTDPAVVNFAGGNGFNGLPVLQFSPQFTRNNNNTVTSSDTPMFDIMNGDYDAQFRRMANDIKAYGKPVLFRLNNEMDTGHVSYCGHFNLSDPDIFVQTWERLYRIFEEEGVDNCIWVFNPEMVTWYQTKWEHWLHYLPDIRMVNVFGVHSYEMGNDDDFISFDRRYRRLYEAAAPYFINFPWGIGEFACGSGGEVRRDWNTGWSRTELHRNKDKQAVWVRDMFRILNNNQASVNRFAQNIKYAVWFSTDDYNDLGGVLVNERRIQNALKLVPEQSGTFEELKKGFADASPHKIRTVAGRPILWTGGNGMSAAVVKTARLNAAHSFAQITVNDIKTVPGAVMEFYADAGFTAIQTMPLTLSVGVPVDLFIKTTVGGAAEYSKITFIRGEPPVGNYLDLFTAGNWRSDSGGGDNRVLVAANPGGGLTFTSAGTHGWPRAEAGAAVPLSIPKAEWSNYTLHYDFTVSGMASITLQTNAGHIRFTNFILNNYGTADDMAAGTYKSSINLAAFLARFGYNENTFEVAGIHIFVVGQPGSTVTVREFRIAAV
jgi:hypothetical protein